MDTNDLHNKVGAAIKWSALTEIMTKFISPLTTMILARLLAPEAFGVVATATMIFSFADMFTDAGFQKYLVQKEFADDRHKIESTSVAFWTNLTISLLILSVIIVFRDQIATLVGNPGLGLVIAVSCCQLIITSFSSIQTALYSRDLNYKTLFLIRIITICIPFVVTIPLALLGWSYWSLIIGTICGSLANAIILTLKSKWKPMLFYSFSLLKEMVSFSVWSLVEAISIWFIGWVDIFIIGSVLSLYYLGLYRTSLATVNGIISLVTAATTPILFASLSRLQHDNSAFNSMFFRVQRFIALFIFPIGTGIFLFSDIATQIFLGSQWTQASKIIGIWALTSACIIGVGPFSEIYRAKGNPRLSFISHIIHLLFLVPVCLISVRYGFWILVYARAIIRMQAVIVDLIILKYVINFPVIKIFSNIAQPFLFTLIMGLIAIITQNISPGFIWKLVSIGICAVSYFVLIKLFASDDFSDIVNLFLRKGGEQSTYQS